MHILLLDPFRDPLRGDSGIPDKAHVQIAIYVLLTQKFAQEPKLASILCTEIAKLVHGGSDRRHKRRKDNHCK